MLKVCMIIICFLTMLNTTLKKIPATGKRIHWSKASAERSAWNRNTVTHTALGMISISDVIRGICFSGIDI